MDPEIPVVSIVDLGIVQTVKSERNRVKVEITPTFAGCPALEVIEREIEGTLLNTGFHSIDVKVRLFPAWSTDM
ncbi:MAG: iron-sulfur cluster assembly protein, partial [Planctomycetota bacterium]